MVKPLQPEQLKKTCDPAVMGFETTREVTPLTEMVGQQRAVHAMNFGLSVRRRGYNIYMSGENGTGKTTYAINLVKSIAQSQPVPPDWVYLYNFRDPDRPQAVALPPGMGVKLREDMERLLEDVRRDVPKAMADEHVERQRRQLISLYQAQTERLLNELHESARRQNFQLQRTVHGFLTIPLKPSGEPLQQDEFNQLPAEVRAHLEATSRKLQEQLSEVMLKINQIEQEAREHLRQWERDLLSSILEPFIQSLKERYRDAGETLLRYFDDVHYDLARYLQRARLQHADDDGANVQAMMRSMLGKSGPGDNLARYKVNVLVDRSEQKGAPVVIESHPVYYNLLGKQEYAGSTQAVTTDHTMIKAGALHEANGGYLILQVRDLLMNPPSWDVLKRALLNEEIQIENIGEQYRAIPVRTMRPQPIPLDIKVILVGTPILFHLLHAVDEDFRTLFKVKADFDTVLERDEDTIQKYAMFISSLCSRENLLHFHADAVARVIEHSSRLADDQRKVSTRFNEVVEVLYEADAWARKEGADLVRARHVQKAIDERIYRNNRIEERLQEMIQRGTIIVQTRGAVVGQVNGLSVLSMDDYAFGRPSRITARTFLGEAGVINIEREIEMSGAIHDKGVLTLSGYLGGTYAQNQPLTLSASLTFEQLYSGVDGDSASSAELYALLSSLADVPIRQDLAVTGSIDQYGNVQPIGGVNEKIEGFFRACKAQGLTGTQGVLIPIQNVENLMLSDEVIDAVRAGQFHIYPIRHVDEGIELLTGLPAGKPEDADKGLRTIHGLVQAKLNDYSRLVAERSKSDGGSA